MPRIGEQKEKQIKKQKPKQPKKKQSQKNLSTERNIELANYVVRYQLAKKEEERKSSYNNIENMLNPTNEEKGSEATNSEINESQICFKIPSNPKLTKVTKNAVKHKILHASTLQVQTRSRTNKNSSESSSMLDSKTRRKKNDSLNQPKCIRQKKQKTADKPQKNNETEKPIHIQNNIKENGISVDGHNECDKVSSSIKDNGIKNDDLCDIDQLSDTFSWVGEISSSNSTVSTANDNPPYLVVFDGKIPIVEINKIDCEVYARKHNLLPKTCAKPKNKLIKKNKLSLCSKKRKLSESISELSLSSKTTSISTSNSSSESSSTKSTNEASDVDGNSNCDLSTNNIISRNMAIENIKCKLESLDLEFLSWLVTDNTVSLEDCVLNDKAGDALKPETEIIKECRKLKTLLNNFKLNEDNVQPCNIETEIPEAISEEVNISVEKNLQSLSSSPKLRETANNEANSKDVENNNDRIDDDDDDDDAISLYAESLSGSENESDKELCKEPIAQLAPVKHKISETIVEVEKIQIQSHEAVINDIKVKPNLNNFQIVISNEISKCQPENVETVESTTVERNSVRKLLSTGSLVTLNSIFNVCVYYQNAMCTFGDRCRFQHRILNAMEIRLKLANMSLEKFICEYKYVRSQRKVLFSKYALLFVEEARKREEAPLLLEMINDYKNIIDPHVRTHCLESVVIFFKKPDYIQRCESILRCDMDDGVLFCDYIISVISVSENIFRFREVLIVLIDWMVSVNKKFSLVDVENILNRISVMQCDEQFLKSMLKIIFNTDPKVFSLSIMYAFKNLLLKVNVDLMQQLCDYREKINGFTVTSKTSPDSTSKEIRNTDGNIYGVNRSCSPVNRPVMYPRMRYPNHNNHNFIMRAPFNPFRQALILPRTITNIPFNQRGLRPRSNY